MVPFIQSFSQSVSHPMTVFDCILYSRCHTIQQWTRSTMAPTLKGLARSRDFYLARILDRGFKLSLVDASTYLSYRTPIILNTCWLGNLLIMNGFLCRYFIGKCAVLASLRILIYIIMTYLGEIRKQFHLYVKNQPTMGKLTTINFRIFKVEEQIWAHSRFIKVMVPCEASWGIPRQVGIPTPHLIIALLSFK